MAASADPDRLLAIYLNDHLAGAALGVELARRLRSSNRGDAEFGRAAGADLRRNRSRPRDADPADGAARRRAATRSNRRSPKSASGSAA